MEGRYFVFSACFSTCFSLASQRKQDVGEEGKDDAEDGMNLGAGAGRKGLLLVRSYNLILCLG